MVAMGVIRRSACVAHQHPSLVTEGCREGCEKDATLCHDMCLMPLISSEQYTSQPADILSSLPNMSAEGDVVV